MPAEPHPERIQPQQIHLGSALAQRIVDELAPAIQENLNLMDSQGFIIASSDVSRVGTLHPGAREAAATNEVVAVHADTARPGERPGVNLPLEHRGRVIGVVGVTGKPAKVRSLAPVLVLTIALLFEREAELVGESRRDAADRDVLARLVFGSRPEDALTLLQQRSPALDGPWVIVAGIVSTLGEGVLDAGAVARLRRTLGPGAVVGA
ncbi:sugar diacid recognition domain-containing protein, partial [Leucobacter sp. BZR 635]